ncbi:MAG: head GIN domain-containing protein [Hyphomonadaceae bacterium]
MPRFALLAAAVGASLCAASPALAETRSYPVSQFTKLDVNAGYKVIFTQSSKRSVTVESEDLSKVVVEEKGDTLRISRPRNTKIKSRKTDIVRVSGPRLELADLNAGVSFTADNITVDDLALDLNAGVKAEFSGLKAKTVTVDANAGVSLEASGSCDLLRIDANAGAEIHARDLKCRAVDVEGQAGSSLKVYASETAQVEAGVGSSIRIFGSPKTVDQEKSLGASVSVE